MAEGFEPYHVPQQSRRDKLRVGGCVDNLQGCAGLLPPYDPSLLSSDLVTCANETSSVKEEGANLMGAYVGGFINNANSSSSSTSQHLYMDPQSSMHLNPSSIQEINPNPFLFAPQNLRVFDQSFNGGDQVLVYKPEPLSLSLSSHHPHLQRYEASIFSDKVTSGGYVVPATVSGGGGVGGGGSGGGSSSNNLSRSAVPLGPFTGYASILKGSRFLKPAQQLLEELCDVGRGIYAENIAAETTLMEAENLGGSGVVDAAVSGGDGGEQLRKKSRLISMLISMLDEVYRRYKYYYQQMQAVVASFESIAGLSNAAPFVNLALKAMSKHFQCLKNAITDQLQFLSKAQNPRKDGTPTRFANSDNPCGQRPVHNLAFLDQQPAWRPQRGLPERAVTVLRSWLFDHFLHPYPTDTDKIMLAKQTGLSRNQVSNWFINARVRLWKPMVEEIHMLETRQAKKASSREEQNADRPNDHHHLPTPTSLASGNPSTSILPQDLQSKRSRNEFPDISMGTQDPAGMSYGNLSRHQQMSVGPSIGGSGSVSLTLGLQQNNGFGLSEPFPINAARHFGLDANNEGFVMGSFEDQNRQFGRGIIGGQLLHDFVG